MNRMSRSACCVASCTSGHSRLDRADRADLVRRIARCVEAATARTRSSNSVLLLYKTKPIWWYGELNAMKMNVKSIMWSFHCLMKVIEDESGRTHAHGETRAFATAAAKKEAHSLVGALAAPV